MSGRVSALARVITAAIESAGYAVDDGAATAISNLADDIVSAAGYAVVPDRPRRPLYPIDAMRLAVLVELLGAEGHKVSIAYVDQRGPCTAIYIVDQDRAAVFQSGDEPTGTIATFLDRVAVVAAMFARGARDSVPIIVRQTGPNAYEPIPAP